MLEQLLKLVGEGGLHSYRDLMERLEVSQPLLESMLEDLVRLGYLRSVSAGCGGTCTACPIGGCSVAGSGRVWTLTGKGTAASRITPAGH